LTYHKDAQSHDADLALTGEAFAISLRPFRPMFEGGFMRSLIPLAVIALSLFAASSFAQQQRKYEVDPKTKWARGARQTPADELKKELDAGRVKIIDVRPAASFERETIPGAINVPLDQLENYLQRVPKDTRIVFT
jgi:Rhodanese-like domain